MQQLIEAARPYIALACAFALLLCLAPLLASRGRTILAAVLGLVPIGLVIDVLVKDHTAEHVLEVPNYFGRQGETEPHRWVTDTVAAPAWHWHMCLAALAAVPALWLFARRRRPAGPPNPILHLWLVFVFFLGLRLGLERTAAPAEVVWGVGVNPTLLVALPFFGFYCGRSGVGFAGLIGRLLLCGLLQRVVVVVWSWFATTRQLGTHLDMHTVTDIELPLVGAPPMTTAAERWFWAVAVPQMTLFLVITLVAGIVLGALPWWWGRRRSQRGGE